MPSLKGQLIWNHGACPGLLDLWKKRLLRKGVASFDSPLHPYPQSWSHWEKANPASPGGSDPQGTSEHFCPAPWGWAARGWAAITSPVEVNTWGQMCEEPTGAFISRLSQIYWKIFQNMPLGGKKRNPILGSFFSSASVFSEPKWQIAFGYSLFHFKEEQSKKMQSAQDTDFPWEIFFQLYKLVWSMWFGDISLKIQTLDWDLFEMKLQIQPLLMRAVILIVLILFTSSMQMTSSST